MNKIFTGLVAKKIDNKAAEIISAAEGEIVISKKLFALELAVALLGGLVLGMFLSPRKNVQWKIASNNNINSEPEEEDEDYYYDEDDGFENDVLGNKSKFIKL